MAERRLTERETDRAQRLDTTEPDTPEPDTTLLTTTHYTHCVPLAVLLVELRARGRWRAATAVALIAPLSTARALSMHALIRRRAARPRPARRPAAVGPALLGRRRSSAPARMRGHGHECSYTWACAQGCGRGSGTFKRRCLRARHSSAQSRSPSRSALRCALRFMLAACQRSCFARHNAAALV